MARGSSADSKRKLVSRNENSIQYLQSENHDQVEKLEELTNVLRLRCSSVENELEDAKKEIERLKHEQEE